eukprot:593731-Rhodomonas_salina.1
MYGGWGDFSCDLASLDRHSSTALSGSGAADRQCCATTRAGCAARARPAKLLGHVAGGAAHVAGLGPPVPRHPLHPGQ